KLSALQLAGLLPRASISISTLARSVKSDESAAAGAPHETLQFQLGQARQQTRDRQAGSLGDRVHIARFSRRQAGQHGVGRDSAMKGSRAFLRQGGSRAPDLLQD